MTDHKKKGHKERALGNMATSDHKEGAFGKIMKRDLEEGENGDNITLDFPDLDGRSGRKITIKKPTRESPLPSWQFPHKHLLKALPLPIAPKH